MIYLTHETLFDLCHAKIYYTLRNFKVEEVYKFYSDF